MKPAQRPRVLGYCCPACGSASTIYDVVEPNESATQHDVAIVATFGWLGLLMRSGESSSLDCGSCGKQFTRPLGGFGFLFVWMLATFLAAFFAFLIASASIKPNSAGPGFLADAAQTLAKNPEAATIAIAAATLVTALSILLQSWRRSRERKRIWRTRYDQETTPTPSATP